MKLVTTFHSASSVIGSLKCRLTSESELEYLVVAKPNRIEVFALTPDGLRPECELEIWGRILALRSVPTTPTDTRLLVLTDHPDPYVITLAFHTNSPTPYLSTLSSVSLFDRNAQHAELCTDAIVSSDGEFAVVSCYKGKLKVLSFEEGKIHDSFDIAIPELNLLSVTFLEYDDQYHLAMAHVDSQRRVQLLSKKLEIMNHDISISTVPSELLPTTTLLKNAVALLDSPKPLHLVQVPQFQLNILDHNIDTEGGVIVIGARSIYYFELAIEQRRKAKTEKRRRLENRKASSTDNEKEKAKEKEKERESRLVKPKASVKWPWGDVTAVLPLDSTFRKILIGDKFGFLSLLTLDTRPSLTLIPIGEVSPPTTLTHLASQMFYVGSHLGNSQLVRLLPAPTASSEADTLPIPSSIKASSPSALSREHGGDNTTDDDKDRANGTVIRLKGSHVEVLESFRNIAPIVDATLADIDGSRQPQLVTCSGENSTGSVNVLQNGADFAELAILEGLTDVVKICPIRSRYESSVHTHVLFSTSHVSQLFSLDEPGSLRRLDVSAIGLNMDVNTHAFNNITKRTTVNGKSSYVDSSWIVHVTQKAVTLLEYDEGLKAFHKVGHEWTPAKLNVKALELDIVAADVSPSQIAVGVEDGHIAILGVNGEGEINMLQFDSVHKEICSISCQSFDYAGMFTTRLAVSFWSDNTVALYGFQGNKLQLLSQCDPLSSLPKSVLLHNFGVGRKAKDADYRPYILAGLVDGSIVSFNLRDNQLQDKKVFSLGGTPVQLSPCDIDGRRAVFASGSTSAILYWDKQSIRYCPVLIKDVVTTARLNTPTFSSCHVFATASTIIVGKVKGVDKMQIRQVPLGYENPRRITYHRLLNEFGVAYRHVTPNRIGEPELQRSTFNVLDNRSFQRISQFICDQNEEVTAVCALDKLDTSNPLFSTQKPSFCIGTVRHVPGEREPSSGRIIVFREPVNGSEVNRLSVLAKISTEGCVWALDVVNDMIVAAINSSVVLYSLTGQPGSRVPVVSLTKATEWNHNYTVISLVAHGHIVTIGDAISSVSVLEVIGKKIKSIARDYGPLWPVAVEALPGNGVIGGNADGNLFTFALEQTGQRSILTQSGSYHLGDMVTKVLPGAIIGSETQDTAVFKPEHIFFTSSGRICQTLHVNDESISLALTSLQHNMSKKLPGPGDVTHSKWRTPTTRQGRSDADAGAVGFLDGDFLEQWLVQSNTQALLKGDNEAERVSIGEARMRDLLEKLQSLH